MSSTRQSAYQLSEIAQAAIGDTPDAIQGASLCSISAPRLFRARGHRYGVKYTESSAITESVTSCGFGASFRGTSSARSAVQLLAVPGVAVPEGRQLLELIDDVGMADETLATTDALRRYFPNDAICIESESHPERVGVLRISVFPRDGMDDQTESALDDFDENWWLEQSARTRSRIGVYVA